METDAYIRYRQNEIIKELGVQFHIDPAKQFEIRVEFARNYMIGAKAKGFVLGISGGLDSFNAGMILQEAVNRQNKLAGTNDYQFIAMRLPYNVQKDETDAQVAIDVIKPTKVITYNIAPAVDVAIEQMKLSSVEISDFVKGNRKARERMLAQYDVAAMYGLLVVGTDHASEAITGFYTKWGDGACDLTVLTSLNKRQGYQLAEYLGAPKTILDKKPTADLLDNNPGRADEDELGVTYEQNSDFLEGKTIDTTAALKLINQYDKTAHKRKPIPGI